MRVLFGVRSMVKEVHSVISNLNLNQSKKKEPGQWRVRGRMELGTLCRADGAS